MKSSSRRFLTAREEAPEYLWAGEQGRSLVVQPRERAARPMRQYTSWAAAKSEAQS